MSFEISSKLRQMKKKKKKKTERRHGHTSFP